MQDCVFCKIAEGTVPANKVYEDEQALAFLDRFPANDGHTLIIPKKHYENIFGVPEEELAYLHKISKKISTAVKAATNADGISIDQSNGGAAGQAIPHFHIHVIPRFDNDNIMQTFRKGNQNENEMKKIAEKIREAV